MKFFVKAASALAVCGSLTIAAVPAQARGWDSYGGYNNHSGSYSGQWGSQSDYRHDRYDRNRSYRNYSYRSDRSDRSYGYYPGSGYGRGYYGYGNDGAALIIGGLIGAVVGSAIANDHRRSDYYDRGYNGYDRGGYDGYYDGYGY